jgi:hypothetical protein
MTGRTLQNEGKAEWSLCKGQKSGQFWCLGSKGPYFHLGSRKENSDWLGLGQVSTSAEESRVS